LLPIFENSANLGACQGQGLRIVPYAGHKGYQCYLDGWKVNGKRKRLYLKDEATAAKKLAELAKQQKQEGQAGLDVPLELRVMAVKAAKRLAPFNKSVLDAAEFYATHLERECSFGPGFGCDRGVFERKGAIGTVATPSARYPRSHWPV